MKDSKNTIRRLEERFKELDRLENIADVQVNLSGNNASTSRVEVLSKRKTALESDFDVGRTGKDIGLSDSLSDIPATELFEVDLTQTSTETYEPKPLYTTARAAEIWMY